MKNALGKKIFGQVSIAHGIVILLAILSPLFRGCTPKPKEVTFFDLSGSPAPAYEQPQESTPEPEIKPKIKQKPEPELKPEKKPEPVKTNAPPKKVETKKPEVKKPEPAKTNAPPKKTETNAPPKPKTEEEKLAAIRQNTKVRNPNAKPAAPAKKALDLSGLKAALNSSATGSGSATSSGSGSGSGSGGSMYNPFAWYYEKVKDQMYAVWQQPAGAPIGLTAVANIRVERDGRVSLKSITRRSGNSLFDQSVQGALNDTARLPMPPPDLPDRNISIEFSLKD